MYRYELHLHSGTCSRCSRQTMEEIVQAMVQKGLAGAVITNHFYHGNTCIDRELSWKEFVAAFENDYLYGKKLADEAGVTLLFGIEEGLSEDRGKEVLIYGVPAEAFARHEELRFSDLPMISRFVHKEGGLLPQAHPFRDRAYVENPDTPPYADLVDGIEFFNTGNSPEANGKSVRYAKEHPEMILIVGSDAHKPEAVGSAVIETPVRIRNDEDLLRVLRERNFRCVWEEE